MTKEVLRNASIAAGSAEIKEDKSPTSVKFCLSLFPVVSIKFDMLYLILFVIRNLLRNRPPV